MGDLYQGMQLSNLEGMKMFDGFSTAEGWTAKVGHELSWDTLNSVRTLTVNSVGTL